MPFSDQLIIYLYSYLPAISLAGFFWWIDRFEREPFTVVAGSFLWGAFGAGLISYFWNTYFHVVLDFYQQDSEVVNSMIVTVLVAPFIEELTKGILIVTFLRFNKVDNVGDGILLGMIIGLGFAASENVHYAKEVIYPASGELATWYNLWFREIHTTILHASSTALWGAMIGYSRYLKGFQQPIAVFNGLILAIMAHGFWNFLASYAGYVRTEPNIVRLAMRVEIFGIFAVLLILFLINIKKQSGTIIGELLEECRMGVIPFEHIGFFASMVRHPRRYRLPQNISPHRYAVLGVRLAFRKHEYRYNHSAKIKGEIEGLRQEIRSLSYDAGL